MKKLERLCLEFLVGSPHLPWHPLDESFAEVIEGNGHLHILVLRVRVAVTHQHDFVVVGHVIVGDGDGGGPLDHVDEPVLAVREGAVVDPDVAPTKDRHAVAVRYGPPPVVPRGAPHVSVPSLLAVVDVNPVDDNVGHVLDCDAGAARDVDAGASPVDGLERVHDELLLQLDRHVPGEDDPQRVVLDHSMAEGPRLRCHRVVITRVGDDVDLAVPSADRVLAEANAAVS